MILKQDPFEGDITPEEVRLMANAKTQPPADVKPSKKQQDNTTLTGEPADQVVINPDKPPLNEAKRSDTIFVLNGRMNPPTKGHEENVNGLHKLASEQNADHIVIASHSQDAKKNPLSPEQKLKHLQRAFPKTNIITSSKQKPTIFHQLSDLHKQGYQHLVMAAGSDRAEDYERVKKYNGIEGAHGFYNFKSISVANTGERKKGISGTDLRNHVTAGNYEKFKENLPSMIRNNDKHAKELFADVRDGLTIKEELEETVDFQQRLRRAVVMRRNAKKIARARQLAKTRLAKSINMRRRALKRARSVVRQRIAGKRGMNYSKLSTSEKIAVDKMADKRKKLIVKIANRLAPKIRRDEFRRLAAAAKGKRVKNDNVIVASYQPKTNDILSEKAALALKNKAEKSGITFEAIVEVFNRGLQSYPSESNLTPQQYAFGRVNSFLANGKAAVEDADLNERKQVMMVARGMQSMIDIDFENLPKVLPSAQHQQAKADIKQKEKESEVRAARAKADLVRRMSHEFNRKIMESGVMTRVANRATRSAAPQMGNVKQKIIDALKKKDYQTLASIIIYLTREKFAANQRLRQENVCIPEEDYIYEEWTEQEWNTLVEENNEGRALNKPFRTPGGPKKFAVYVKNDKGNIIKLGFGDPNLEIKRDDPERRKAYRARHGCDNPGPKWKANYWSCNWSWSASKKVGA